MTGAKQEPPEEKEPIKVSFSLPQITGGALAAATAAAIGSQLGVAGTILGAMVASIVGGVAGTLYSAGIDRTHRKVTRAIVRGYDRVRHDASYDPDELHSLAVDGGGVPTDGAPTRILPGLDEADLAPATGTARADLAPVEDAAPRRRKPVWTVMALTVGAMFLVALAVVTVVELGLGRSLDGRSGTTVGQVVEPRSSAKPTPTATETPSPTTDPTATSTPTPTATDTPTPTPTATDTPTATTDPTATPTPTAPETSVPADNAQPSQSAQPLG